MPIYRLGEATPRIPSSAYVAPEATIIGSVVLSLAWVESATGQSSRVPDLSGGEGGWVHARGAGAKTYANPRSSHVAGVLLEWGS